MSSWDWRADGEDMDTIKVVINRIKNIKHAELELPFENGVYSLVGTNGCGKSTILLLLAQLVYNRALDSLKREDFSSDSSLSFEINGVNDTWTYSRRERKWISSRGDERLRENGMHEGSLFYGTRFNDSRNIDDKVKSKQFVEKNIVPADDYVKETLSYILHGDKEHYSTLSRIKNRGIAEHMKVRNLPYFINVNEHYISQYRMSSGECLLVSLLHFIYNAIIRRSLPTDKKVLVLIDEIELALHPIAVRRLVQLLTELAAEHKNLIVILTSHSPEIIKSIPPSNLYKVENVDGEIDLETNCYPSYLIRDIYTQDGYDYVFLVEDKLAKCVVDKILLDNNLRSSKLLQVIPVGGWNNVLQLQKEFLSNNILGINTSIVSILDGDVEDKVNSMEEFKDTKKLFLPILSLEKFLFEKLSVNPDRKFVKLLNDKYFTMKSLNELVKEYKNNNPNETKKDGKKLYYILKQDLQKRNISEEVFVTHLCDDILKEVDFGKFITNLKKMLNKEDVDIDSRNKTEIETPALREVKIHTN
ncbi:MAG: AAA family ATPase [Prevotella sp.]|nr:AAA family ATPase [Prevotella sp.]